MTELKDNSEKFKTQFKKVLNKALTEAAIHAEGSIISKCPVDTGHLKGSISFLTRGVNHNKEGGLKGVALSGEAYIGTNVEYAPHVEYGTVKQKPQAFMRNGMDEAKEGIKQIIANNLKGLKIKDE